MNNTSSDISLADQLLYYKKRAEELELSDQRYRSMFKNMEPGSCLDEIVYENGAAVNYRILEINPSFERILGIPRSKAVGSLSTDAYGTTEPPFFETYVRVAETGKSEAFESFFEPAGKYLSLSVSCPEPGKFSTVFTDISESKKLEFKLKESEQLNKSFINTHTDHMFIKDSKYRYLSANNASVNFLGKPHAEIIGKTDFEIMESSKAKKIRAMEVSIIKSGKSLTFEEIIGDRILETTKFPLQLQNGKTGLGGICRDIAEKKKTEEELRQSQKMESIGLLAGGIAHDFNNILQAILGYSQLLSDSLPSMSEHHIELNEIKKCGERAAKLTRQLLAFSRKQIIQPKVVDLNEIIDNTQSMLKRIIGEHINLNWFPGFKLGKISADVSMMEQVLANLCINSRDSMPDGGTLTIETQNVVFDKEYCKSHTWARVGRYVLLSITDTGHGISKDTLPHVFEPFFTTKGKGKGTGLGLSTVYGIIRQHEGMITVYSEVGNGTTFKLYYPICERKAKEIDNLIETPIASGNETILLAEDDESVRNLAVLVLQQAGYTVLPASDGFEAVESFNKNQKSIDLLILDVVMPNMGGYEVLKKILKKFPGTPALFCSGYSENSIHNEFVLKEGIRLIEKPYSSRQLLRAVRKTLDDAKRIN
jgi:two-component system, cell cycle sensor histidine kinase and response regulator CckA